MAEAPPLVHALAGAVASIFSNTVVYPLDLITTRIQTQAKESDNKSGTSDRSYDGLLDTFAKVYDEEGLLALYRGLAADNASTMLSTFCYHFAYNTIREARMASYARASGGKRPRVLGMVEELTIGAGAGVISRFVTSPASNVVTRSQTQAGSTADIVRSIYDEKGITGFWSGMKASVLLAANPSISYYLFELQKALLIPRSRRNAPSAIEIFLMSATGKAIATLLLYPVILIKARTQATHAKTSILTQLRKVIDSHGVQGLYSGALPQVVKGFLSQGILMLLKDRITTVIIAGYLMLARLTKSSAGKQSSTSILAFPSQPDRSGNLHYVDSPRQDVNGLILATRDAVEQAVDAAVDKVGQVVGEVKEVVESVTSGGGGGDRAVAAVCNAAGDAEAAMALLPGSHIPKVGGAATNGAAPKQGVEWTSQTRATPTSTKQGVEWASQQRAAPTSAKQGVEWASQTRPADKK